MQRNTFMTCAVVAAVWLLAMGWASAAPSGQTRLSLGDMACQWASASAALPAPGRPLDFSDSHCDLARSGDRVVYEYSLEVDSLPVKLQIASPLTGTVYVDSLLPTDRFVWPGGPAFSPDGNWVAFISATEGKPISKSVRLWVVRSDGTGLRVLRDDGWDYAGASWRPDARLIATARTKTDESSPTGAIIGEETVLVDVASGGIVASVKPALFGPKFSPDGKWLLGIRSEALVALRLETGERRTVWAPKVPPSGGVPVWGLGDFAWGADSDKVLFNRGRRVFDLKGGPYEEEMWEASVSRGWARKVSNGKLLCASPDGGKVLIDQRNTHQIYARRKAKQAELRAGDLQLLTVVGIIDSCISNGTAEVHSRNLAVRKNERSSCCWPRACAMEERTRRSSSCRLGGATLGRSEYLVWFHTCSTGLSSGA